jgi:uncharacterized small protein (DUF1192 family)
VGLDYLLVPPWFAETFIIDHANAESWQAQKQGLLVVDSLRRAVTVLQDSILRLEAAKSDAWSAGYAAANQAYEGLSRRYQAELRKPRLSLGPPVGLAAGLGVGLLLGSLIGH